MQHAKFKLNEYRNAEPQHFQVGGVSGARIGVSGGGMIEDNGFAATELSNSPISQQDAARILADTYEAVRNRPPTDIPRGSATAASAVLTTEGVAIRGAGDSIALAIGDNGKVRLLNVLHIHPLNEAVYNALKPQNPDAVHNDCERFFSWDELESELDTRNIRIAVMSDGVSRASDPEAIQRQLHQLIAEGNVSFDNPDYAAKLVQAVRSSTSLHPKDDDITVVSATWPTEAARQSVLHVFDGVGKGGYDSAVVAYLATQDALSSIESVLGQAQGSYAAKHPKRDPLEPDGTGAAKT